MPPHRPLEVQRPQSHAVHAPQRQRDASAPAAVNAERPGSGTRVAALRPAPSGAATTSAAGCTSRVQPARSFEGGRTSRCSESAGGARQQYGEYLLAGAQGTGEQARRVLLASGMLARRTGPHMHETNATADVHRCVARKRAPSKWRGAKANQGRAVDCDCSVPQPCHSRIVCSRVGSLRGRVHEDTAAGQGRPLPQ